MALPIMNMNEIIDVTNSTSNGNRVIVAVAVAVAPDDNGDVNLVGLPLFFLLGLEFKQGVLSHFYFDKDDIARDVVAMSFVPYF